VNKCPNCKSDIGDDSRYCSNCGSPIDISAAVTRTDSTGPGRLSGTGSISSLDNTYSSGTYPSGTVINERYRIESLVGKGGMGEVYRAEDLKLKQVVALKFLPPGLADHPSRLELFLNEVRITRRISHPNVCRVYDVDETEGCHFLTMEFIDGEDLGSLLRRIGRLPEDKAIEIARQLCAGLAAAHKQGVFHRDLKPANIMLDGEGTVRITDFGLAILAEEAGPQHARSGTPAYMAPEQLQGREVTIRSDLFSLGLVLFEIFTGKRVFKAKSFDQLNRLHQTPRPSLRELNERLDPAVDQVITRCLENDPGRRPGSALEVAAALPGGDSLAAALEAGETPSPELIATAGSTGKLRLVPGLICLLIVVLGLLSAVKLGDNNLLGRVKPEKTAGTLAGQARTLLSELGYAAEPADSAFGFRANWDYLRHIESTDSSPKRWDRLSSDDHPGMVFWYRQSPRLLAGTTGSMITIDDPPFLIAGMVRMLLSPSGRLMSLEIQPAKSTGSETVFTSWDRLFDAAGLDPAEFQEAESDWVPPVFADNVRSWVRETPDSAIRVEAGSFRGKVAYFMVFMPWSRDIKLDAETEASDNLLLTILAVILSLSLLSGCVLLAHRNIKKGRGNPIGAARVSICLLLVGLASWALRADHVADLGKEADLFARALAFTVLTCFLIWLLYVALEPYLRKRWPEGVISWNRLLTGRFSDPLIARDLLIGSAFGVSIAFCIYFSYWMYNFFSTPPPIPDVTAGSLLLGPKYRVGNLLDLVSSAVQSGLGFFLVLLLARLLLRRDWLALLVVFLIGILNNFQANQDLNLIFALKILLIAFVWCLIVFLMLRFGLLAGMAGFFTANFILTSPLTTDLSAWYSGATYFTVSTVLLLAGYGFLVSVEKGELLSDDLD